jgi:hypothetical protein
MGKKVAEDSMSLDFQSIREQVKLLGENAIGRAEQLQDKRAHAIELLATNSQNVAGLRQKVESVVRNYDSSLRCALPVSEELTASFPVPALEQQVTILAADGSQITPDRNAEVNYALINVGAIQMRRGEAEPPMIRTVSQLLYDDQLYTSSGTITDARLALMRDLNERTILAKLAEDALPPVVTFTDGPMELWIEIVAGGQETKDTTEMLEAYMRSLTKLHEFGAITAGYVDKPAANLVVRTLEVAMTPETELPEIKDIHPLRGVTDIALYRNILGPGERSPVFALQSLSARSYQGPLALHFFYLNASMSGHSDLARVDIPAWVAENLVHLDTLHASLIDQCRVMGTRSYPYLLHRAHETAVVRLPEKEQVTLMIAQELRAQGVQVGEMSAKQSAKQLEGRTRIKG